MTQNNEASLEPIEIDGELYYALEQVQVILGNTRITRTLSYTGMNNILKRHNIQRYKLGFGLEKYVKKSDIDKLLKPRIVEG